MCSTNYLQQMKFFLRFTLLGFFLQTSWQTLGQDSTLHFSGSIGLTTNGFSIIPTFSLNSPAVLINLAWKKRNLSFEPDIRLVPDVSKGAMIWWLRYQVIDQPKWKLRVGAHPALTLIRREDTEQGVTTEITELLRFGAFEVVPSVQLSRNIGISSMYLEGHGLQKHGPQITRALFLNTAFSNLPLGSKGLSFNVFPSIFFLYTDGFTGQYLTCTGGLSHTKYPFGIQGTFNKTLRSNVPNNQNFMWNVTVTYRFSKAYKAI